MKKQLTLAQQIKKDLKINFPELKVSCTGGNDPKVYLLNLHSTNYSYKQIDTFCGQYRKVDYCEITNETLLGGLYVPVMNDTSEELKKELREMFINYYNDSVEEEYQLPQGEWFCSADLIINYDEWNQLLENECYCDLADKPEVITEVKETRIVTKQELVGVKVTHATIITAQEEIKKDIQIVDAEINKLSNLLDYLDKNNIDGEIYSVTKEKINSLDCQLSELKLKLSPTVEIKKQIEINTNQLHLLSNQLSTAVSNLDLANILQIQEKITLATKELEYWQNKLNNHDKVIPLFAYS